MMKLLPFSLLIIALTFLNCSTSDDQREFEREAYSIPENITEASEHGEIISNDKDDWRIAPLFQGLVDVEPPFPNPQNTASVIELDIYFRGVNSIEGIEVLTFYDDMDPHSGFKPLETRNETFSSELLNFQIDPLELGEQPVPESARGLHRIFIFDGRGQMISYGDILIE